MVSQEETMRIDLNGRCIKRLREHLKQTPNQFARFIKIPTKVIVRWEDEPDTVLDPETQYYVAKLVESKNISLEMLVEWSRV